MPHFSIHKKVTEYTADCKHCTLLSQIVSESDGFCTYELAFYVIKLKNIDAFNSFDPLCGIVFLKVYVQPGREDCVLQ